jgi:hypothetical protein
MALVARFIHAQGASETTIRWGILDLSPMLSVPLISFSLGYIYGCLSRNTGVEAELSLAETFRLLNDVSMRQLKSGNPAQVNLIASLSYETEVVRRKANSVLDKIWQIRTQLNDAELRQQLAAAIGARRLRVWLGSGEQQLIVGREMILEFRIEPFQETGSDATTALEAEPAGESSLLIQIVSDHIDVKGVPARLALPPTGASSVAQAVIVPRIAGECSLTFLIASDETLDLLQTYAATVEVLSIREGS